MFKPLRFRNLRINSNLRYLSTFEMESSDLTHLSVKNDLAKVFQYHNESKHSQTKYATGPNGLDWQNQPNPFRTFSQEAERKQLFVEQSEVLVEHKESKGFSIRIDLPVPPDFQEKSASTHCKYDELFEHSKEFHSEKLTKLTISQVLITRFLQFPSFCTIL